MSFDQCLRRHLHEKAAGAKKHTWCYLADLVTPPSIMVTLIPVEEVRSITSSSLMGMRDERIVKIVEQVAIEKYEPLFWDTRVSDGDIG